MAVVVSDPCQSIRCENGGTCESNGTTAACKCQPGFDPLFCANTTDLCTSKFCLNGGTCTTYKGTMLFCECSEGFSGVNCGIRAPSKNGWLRKPNGTLIYPPNSNETYEHVSNKEWTIKTMRTKVLNITFTKFDVEESSDCKNNYLQVSFIFQASKLNSFWVVIFKKGRKN